MGQSPGESIKTSFTKQKVGHLTVGVLVFEAKESKNALSKALVSALEDEVRTISKSAHNREISILILHGDEGHAFCSGANLKERQGMQRSEIIDFIDSLNDLFDRIERLPILTVAAIEGAALGGGLELALACDLRVAGSRAVLGLSEVSLGIIPGAGGTYRLMRVLPEAKAFEAIMTAKKFSAQEAEASGLVSAVFSEKPFLKQVFHYLEQTFSSISPFAVRQAKRTFDAFRAQTGGNFRQIERSFYLNTLYSADRVEGLSAFHEKRAPKFTGEATWIPES